MRGRSVMKADHEMIVIGEESPCLQSELVVFRQLEGCVAQEVQFRA